MSFLSSLLGAFTGDSAASSIFNFTLQPFQTLMDSLGLSPHGRDQYFQRDLSWDMLESQQNFQREMFNKSADFNSEQAQLGRDFTMQMYQKQLQDYLKNYPSLLKMQSDSAFNIWRNQFQMQNDYNSPGAQTQRLLAAGINPSSVFGGSGSVATSQMGASNLQQPSLISPTPFGSASTPVAGSPVGLPSGYIGNMSNNISDVGSFLKDISEMRLNEKKTGRYDEQINALIKQTLAEAGLKEEESKYQKLITGVDSFMLPHQKAADIKLKLAEAAKYSAEGDELKAEERLNDALSELNKTKNVEAKARLPFIEMEARAEIDDIRASAAEKRAAAKEAEQRTKTEEFNTKISEIRAEVDNKTKLSKIATIINSLSRQRSVDKSLIQEARLRFKRLQDINIKKDSSWLFNEVDGFLNWFTSHIGVAINGNASTSTVKHSE